MFLIKITCPYSSSYSPLRHPSGPCLRLRVSCLSYRLRRRPALLVMHARSTPTPLCAAAVSASARCRHGQACRMLHGRRRTWYAVCLWSRVARCRLRVACCCCVLRVVGCVLHVLGCVLHVGMRRAARCMVRAGQVLWSCDPMHGNTEMSSSGVRAQPSRSAARCAPRCRSAGTTSSGSANQNTAPNECGLDSAPIGDTLRWRSAVRCARYSLLRRGWARLPDGVCARLT